MSKLPVSKQLAALIDDSKAIFAPTYTQSMAKQRLHEALDLNPLFDKANLTLEQVAALSKEKQIQKWAKEPGFLTWLLDKDDFKKRATAYADTMLEVLVDIIEADLEPKVITAKDKINAINLLYQIADKFPTKRKEVVVLDKELDKIGDDEIDRRINEMARRLAETSNNPIIDIPPEEPSDDDETETPDQETSTRQY